MKKKTLWQRINPFAPKRRKYEGASKSKRLKSWFTENSSANAQISTALPILRDRSRDLRRNNPFAARAIVAISTNTVGLGIQTQFQDKDNVQPTNPCETDWRAWAHSKDFDFDGRHDIFGFQRMIMQAVAESGEILVRKRYDKKKDFPLQYQILEADFIDSTQNSDNKNGGVIIQGIEFDSQGRRVAYWLYEQHPGNISEQLYGSQLKSNRVPASELFHIFRQERPGQARGVPWLAPCIIRLKDLDDYEDAQLMRQKIAACFTAFVQDISADVATGDFTEGESTEDLLERLEPGQIEFLPTGKSVTFSAPPEVANYDQFTKNVLRSIAAGFGISYEVLTGDLSEVNFSSARMGWIEFKRNIDVWRKEILMDPFLDPVVQDFKRVAAIKGKNFDNFKPVHTPPKREMIDPTKELEAAKASVLSGFSTWSEELMSLGKDPQEHFAQYQKDLDLIKSLKLPLDTVGNFGQALTSPVPKIEGADATQKD